MVTFGIISNNSRRFFLTLPQVFLDGSHPTPAGVFLHRPWSVVLSTDPQYVHVYDHLRVDQPARGELGNQGSQNRRSHAG